MMTINEVMAVANEWEAEYKAGRKDRCKELRKILESDKARVFKCSECGRMVTYFDLEVWTCDFEEGEYICSLCYEDYMGEDL